MQFGYFDDNKREYVINKPNTPYPWINYLGNEDFYSLISNTSGGYCFYKDAKMLRLSRYRYNSVPCDNGGRYFYINEGGKVWTPGFLPSKTDLDSYECRHGMGYTTIKSSLNDLEVTQTTFVPMGSPAEVTRLKLKNNSNETKSFTTFSFVEFCLWNAHDDMTNFQRNYSIGEVEVCGSAIYHKTEYRERRNHYAVFAVNTEIDGFDTDRESFIGLYNGFDRPDVVAAGMAKNSIASGWSPIGSHAINITLQPGEEKSYIYLLGYCENPKEEKWEAPNIINKTPAKKMIDSFKTDAQVDAALLALSDHWDKLLSNYQLKSSDDKLNRMVNVWNQYQCMVTFNMSRSASYFESGIGRGMGFRDSTQDLLGFVHLIPSRARDRIIDIASTQWEDGSAYHQYQPLTKKGNMDVGSGFNDDPLWLIFGVAAYIKETGDWDILNEMVPFDSNENNKATLMQHLKASFRHVTNNLGPHGLPLIGRADWNDCLNLNCFSENPGDSFQTCSNFDSGIAESLFIAGMFVYIGDDYISLCEHFGFDDESKFAKTEIKKMYDNTITHGWDGNWFLRAYDAYGEKVGSHECSEGQIFIEPQGFCVMAGIGVEEGLAKIALESVEERLDTKYGIVLLNPPYETYHLNLGEISSYPPGYKENAGIFCHNNPWIAIAETKLGNGNRAFEIYKKTCPAYLEEISDIHRTEPYVYSQMIAGKDAVRFGEAKNSWLTGTAAWSFYSISQDILGIKPDYNGLRIEPCIPEDMAEYTITRKFRGDTYVIHIDNSQKVMKGVKSITVDGKNIDGNIVPVIGDGAIHTVEVTMGI